MLSLSFCSCIIMTSILLAENPTELVKKTREKGRKVRLTSLPHTLPPSPTLSFLAFPSPSPSLPRLVLASNQGRQWRRWFPLSLLWTWFCDDHRAWFWGTEVHARHDAKGERRVCPLNPCPDPHLLLSFILLE